MSNKIKNGIASKAALTFLSFSTALFVGGATIATPLVAHADMISDLQAQIAALTAQLAALSSSSSSSSSAGNCGFTRDLTVGSTGNDVMCLQKYLNGAGFMVSASGAGSPGSESTYFGAKTKAAVAKWQAANGVSPTAGYFGSISRAKYNSMVASTPPSTTPPSTTPSGGPAGTGLSVAAGTQPAASLAPESAARVPFTRIRLTASADGDVTVNSVTVERTGLMNDAAISGIVVLDDQGMQVSTIAKTLNSNHQAVLNDSFVVPRGMTKEYTIAANMPSNNDAHAGEVGFLSVIAVNAGSATVTGTLPVTGAAQTINATLSIGSVTMDVGSNDPRNNPTKEVGTKDYVFSSVKLTAGSAEDVLVKGIRWNQSGSVGITDLANVKTYDSKGNNYPVVVSADGKYYVSSFGSGVTVLKGDVLEAYIKGDIAGGSGRTADFDVYRSTDVIVSGKTFGYDIIPPDGTDTSGTDDSAFHQNSNPWFDASQVTVGTGSLQVEKSNSVSAGNVAPGGNNQALGAFTLTVRGEAVNFASFPLVIATSSGSGGALTNVAIYDENGAAVMGPKDCSRSGTSCGTLTFTDSVTVPVGAHTYTVRAKLNNSWNAAATIQVSVTPANLGSVTGQTTGNSITPTPATAVTANAQTVKASNLVVTPSSSLFAQNVIKGANGVELGRFNLDASNSGDDLRVTIIKVTADVVSGLDVDNLNNIQLFDGTTALTTGSNIVNPSGNVDATDATLTFTLDNALIITKGSNKIISLKANISNAADATDSVRFNFTAQTDGDWSVIGVNNSTEITEDLDIATVGSTMTVSAGGSYSITQDSSAGQSQSWYTGGSTGVTLGAFRIKTTTETFTLKNLQVQLTNTASSSASDMTALYIYNGSTLVAKKTFPAFTSNVENFTFNVNGAVGDGSANNPTQYLMIPADTNNTILTLKADLIAVTTTQGTSGHLIAVDIGPGSNQQNRAVGSGSGTDVSPAVIQSDGVTLGTTTVAGVRYFRGVPKVEVVSLPSGTSLGSGASIYRFKVTAVGGDVGIYKLTFQISTSGGSGMTVDQIKLTDDTIGLDVTNAITLVGTTTCIGLPQPSGHQTCNFDTNGNVVLPVVADNSSFPKSAGSIRITSGDSHTFTLKANSVALTSTTGEKVTTQLLGDGAYVIATTSVVTDSRVGVGKGFAFQRNVVDHDVQDDFIWTDFLGEATSSATTATTNDWVNGFRVANLNGSDLDAVTVSE